MFFDWLRHKGALVMVARIRNGKGLARLRDMGGAPSLPVPILGFRWLTLLLRRNCRGPGIDVRKPRFILLLAIEIIAVP